MAHGWVSLHHPAARIPGDYRHAPLASKPSGGRKHVLTRQGFPLSLPKRDLDANGKILQLVWSKMSPAMRAGMDTEVLTRTAPFRQKV
jgi:hypothetical protein